MEKFSLESLIRALGSATNCDCCGSKNLKRFTAETAIHFPGLAGLKKPVVWVFPQLFVFSDCGTACFTIPTEQLRVLFADRPATDEQQQQSKQQEGPRGSVAAGPVSPQFSGESLAQDD
jgi:hypothetical protein